MKVRTSVKRTGAALLGSVALAGAGISLRRLNRTYSDWRAYVNLQEAFIYNLAHVSGYCYGRMAVAADDQTNPAHAIRLTQFDYKISIKADITDTTARWVRAEYHTTAQVGRIRCTVAGDEDTLVRLERWLRKTVYSVMSDVQLNAERTELTFTMDDFHHENVRAAALMVEARSTAAGTDTSDS